MNQRPGLAGGSQWKVTGGLVGRFGLSKAALQLLNDVGASGAHGALFI